MKKIIFAILGIGTILAAVEMTPVNEISLEKITQKYEQAVELKAKYQMDGNSLIREAKSNPKDRIVVEIGDKSKAEFSPEIKLSRWDEVDFKLIPNLDGVATKDKDLSFEGEKIKFDTPKVSYEMFETTEEDGGYKYIWYLNEKPATNKVEFQIESEGLDFFYQPALDEEYPESENCSPTECDTDGDGILNSFRPENVIGSYAVYHQTKGGLNDINGKEYKTGKAFHIYRPHIIDAEGKETWGILHIENGIYSVEIPQEFLDTAVYPIKSNDTFGYTTLGASNATDGNNAIYAYLYAGAVGTGNSMSLGTQNTGYNFKLGLYLASDSSLIASTNAAASILAAFVTVNFISEPTLTAVNYKLAYLAESSPSLRFDTVGSYAYWYQTRTYSLGFTNPASFTQYSRTHKFSIYATYTPSGGGAVGDKYFLKMF